MLHRQRLLLFSIAICCTKAPEKIVWNENSTSPHNTISQFLKGSLVNSSDI